MYIVKPQFKPWLAKIYMLSHSLWGRSWPGGWLKCLHFNIPFQQKGRCGEEGWRKRNSTHEEFVLTRHQDSLFIAVLKAENAPWSHSVLVCRVKAILHCYRDSPVYTQHPLTQHQDHYAATGETMLSHMPGCPLLFLESKEFIMDTSFVTHCCCDGT